MPPDYTAFSTGTLGHARRGEEHGAVLTDVANNLSDVRQLIELTANDPSQLNDTIDAQLDRLIAASNSDPRLALFAAAVALGTALRQFLGPRGGGR